MAITVNSGFWGSSYALISSGHPLEHRIKNLMRRRGMKTFQKLTTTLLGAVAGTTATGTYKRIAGTRAAMTDPVTSVGSVGGIRTIDTRTQISRATTAADDTRITNMMTNGKLPSSSVSDRSGNGK